MQALFTGLFISVMAALSSKFCSNSDILFVYYKRVIIESSVVQIGRLLYLRMVSAADFVLIIGLFNVV